MINFKTIKFYEEKKISNALSCKKCHERLDEPRILPCGDSICTKCLSTIKIKNKQVFDCIVCKKQHIMPENGLLINKVLLDLLSVQPTDVYRGKSVETLKESLNLMHKNIASLKFVINND